MLARNVLIFHAGALGDFVLTWPLGLALGRLYPQSRVIYVTQRQKGLLAEKVLRLDSTDIDNGWHHLFGEPNNLPPACRKMLEGSHAVFTFLAKADNPWTKSVASIAPGADLAFTSALPPPASGIHASQHLVNTLASKPVVRAAVEQLLASIATSGIRFSRPSAPGPILIHPGSGSKEKCWPLESYLELVKILGAKKIESRIILGEVEFDRWPADAITRAKSAAPVFQPATYLDLLNELAAAKAFIGNDSGPAHLAGIIGIPTLALFGPTDPLIWKPLGPRVATIHQPLETLSPQQVASAISQLLSSQ